uniref:Uncharacterized protein n=1 Tax=Parascaris univalens TaxID=6257 RepID=A0A915A2B7_PARUN
MSKVANKEKMLIPAQVLRAEKNTGNARLQSSSSSTRKHIKVIRDQQYAANKLGIANSSRQNYPVKKDFMSSAESSVTSGNAHIPRSNRWRQDISESTSFRSSRRDRTLSESIRSMNSSRRRTRDRIKAFLFSRPMSEKSVKKVVARIKRREELRRDAALGKPAVSPTASPNVLRSSDDTFPSAKRRIECISASVKSPESKESRERRSSVSSEREKRVQQLIQGSKETFMQQKYKIVKNKDNNGHLLDECGIPFWSARSNQAKEEEYEEEDTDEELPMNADLLLEVQAGRMKLVNMPEMSLLMDPYEAVETLKSRDGVFFNKDVLFSNTVRTMVNINDEVEDNEKSKKVRAGRKVQLVEPETITNYTYDVTSEQMRWNIEQFEGNSNSISPH